ncbi:hypothetical protein [Streptomyces sp. NPDC046909]|uniref:hypothetical protein n=1 Tax=Streptomyces sp. NPDC046909 TaxID=3155617 RepID=UPI0033BFB864
MRFGKRTTSEVVVVVEADGAFVGVLEVFPCLVRVGEDYVYELGVEVFGLDAAQVGDVVALDGGVR